MIKFIYFDVGSVMVDNDAAMDSVAKTHKISRDAIVDLVLANWKAACRGELGNQAYLDLFTKKFGITHPSSNFVDFWSDHQGHYQQTHDFIYELTNEYRLGILSNAEMGMLQRLLDKKKIPNIHWEVIIESAKHGTVKPETKIYEIAESFVPDLTPHELFFIDDHIEMVEAATKRGWHGEVFDPHSPEESIKKIKHRLKTIS